MQQIPLKRIIWDYNVDAGELHAFLCGEKERFHHFTREMLYVRILERLFWYEILDFLPLTVIKQMLTPKTISMLRSESMRQKYDYAAGILHKQTLSPSVWDHRNHKKSQYPILSDRRYSGGQVPFSSHCEMGLPVDKEKMRVCNEITCTVFLSGNPKGFQNP